MSSFKDLENFEAEYQHWVDHNFPNSTAAEQVLGVGEEFGELAHAVLKGLQGIRHTPDEIKKMKKDAVGDIIIYLTGYCYREGFSLADCLEMAWDEVKFRDWVENTKDGT